MDYKAIKDTVVSACNEIELKYARPSYDEIGDMVIDEIASGLDPSA